MYPPPPPACFLAHCQYCPSVTCLSCTQGYWAGPSGCYLSPACKVCNGALLGKKLVQLYLDAVNLAECVSVASEGGMDAFAVCAPATAITGELAEPFCQIAVAAMLWAGCTIKNMYTEWRYHPFVKSLDTLSDYMCTTWPMNLCPPSTTASESLRSVPESQWSEYEFAEAGVPFWGPDVGYVANITVGSSSSISAVNISGTLQQMVWHSSNGSNSGTGYVSCDGYGIGTQWVYKEGQCTALANTSCSVTTDLFAQMLLNLGLISAPQFTGASVNGPSVAYNFYYANSTGASYLNMTYTVESTSNTPQSIVLVTPDGSATIAQVTFLSFVVLSPATFEFRLPSSCASTDARAAHAKDVVFSD